MKRRALPMIALMIALWIIGGIITGCAMLGKPVEVFRIVEGQIDNALLTEIADGKDFLSVTHVGFTNSQGISLVGVQPGLSKGKTIKLRLRFYKVIRGTSYYEVLQINTGILSEPELSTLPESRPKQ